MNSIRHVLSTSIVFRKVQRGQNKSLWAILEKDIPCFEGGGFDRRLCEDMNNAKSKARPRKRRAETTNEPPVKRFKLERPPVVPIPFYPPTASMLANPHLQPYYNAYNYPYAYPNPAYFAAVHAPASYGQPQTQATSSSSQSPPQPVPDLSSSAGFSSSPVTSLKEQTSSQNTELEDAVEIVNEQGMLGSDGIEPLATLLRSDVLDSDPPQKPSGVKVNCSAKDPRNAVLNYFDRRTTRPADLPQSLQSPLNHLFFHRHLHERPRLAEGLCLHLPLALHVVCERARPLSLILPPHPQPPPPSPPTLPKLPPARRVQTCFHLNTSLRPQLHPTRSLGSRSLQGILPSTPHLSRFLTLMIPGLYWTKS